MTLAMKKLIERLFQITEERQDEVAMPSLKKLQGLCEPSARPLSEMIGAGTGVYESPEEVDQEIHNQREEWDY